MTEQKPIQVTLRYTVEDVSKAEAARQASKLASRVDNRILGFSCGTRYVDLDTEQ